MKSQRSVSNICKRFASYVFLAGSLVFSTPAFSKPECDALHAASDKAGVDYMAASSLCIFTCPSYALKKYEIYVAAYDAWKACEGA